MAKRKQKSKPYAITFYSEGDTPDLTVPSNMTVADAVRLGFEFKLVPKDAPMEPNTYRHHYKQDTP